jgi:hypothetical protein
MRVAADVWGCKTSSSTPRSLGIEAPWRVDQVALRLEDGEIDVFLEHEPWHARVRGEAGELAERLT